MPVIISQTQGTGIPYTDYKIDREAKVHQGVIVIPVAGPPGTPPKIVRTYAPYMEKRATWAVERLGVQPVVPHWDTGDPNTIPVELNFYPMSPLPIDEYRQAWRMEGEYHYVSSISPNMVKLSLAAGAITPAATPTPEQNTITIEFFSKVPLREKEQDEPTVDTDLLEGIVG